MEPQQPRFEEEYEYEEGDGDLSPLEQLLTIFEGQLDEDTITEALRVNDLDFDSAYDFLQGLLHPSIRSSVFKWVISVNTPNNSYTASLLLFILLVNQSLCTTHKNDHCSLVIITINWFSSGISFTYNSS